MKIHYIVEIENPERHHVKVRMQLTRPKDADHLRVFLPSWSPGSYLMREYARHVRWFGVTQANGEVLFHEQKAKGIWEINWSKSSVNTLQDEIQVGYDIYCKELTVRTSHVDHTHAFLHGPSYLMGIEGESLDNPTIEFRFPALWSKLSTSLKVTLSERNQFIYTAQNYDELIDTPVEIGCHETDGFLYLNRPHHLAFYGTYYPHREDLKEDIKKIVEVVARHFNEELPYENYLFITHFAPQLYGGLEHMNSTALQFDGRKLSSRKEYLKYLSLVGHEYFHLWNVKRIRPQELGPFNYLHENYTTLLWLAEGLTSFMDDLFLYRANLCTLEEYLEIVKSNFETYFSTYGRNFHSLEQSSFNAWVKLYRPDENSKNSSVSYYLKGGLVFMALHGHLFEKGKSINDLILALWSDFKQRPESGITKDGIYALVSQIGGEEVLNNFSTMVETTVDIDFEGALKKMGLEMSWQESKRPWIGVEWDFVGDRVMVKSVTVDGPSYRAGVNAGDEIIFINGLRFLKDDAEKLSSFILVDTPYELIVSRLGRFERLEVIPVSGPRTLKEIIVVDKDKAQRALGWGVQARE